MKFRNWVYYETDEDGIILDSVPHSITLKEEVDVIEVGKKLGATLRPETDAFEYDTSETEFRKFLKGKSDKFSNSLPTFKTVND